MRIIADIKKTILPYIEIFLLLLLTVGPVPTTIKIVSYFGLLLLNYRYFKAFINWSIFDFVFLASMIVPMVIDIANVDSSTPYSLAGFAYLIPFVFSRLYPEKYNFNDFIKKLEEVCFFCSFCSLFGMALVLFLPSIVYRFPVVTYYGRRVYTIGLFGAIDNGYSINLLARNCGIAFEPGAFQFVANLGVVLLLRKFVPFSRKNSVGSTTISYVKISVYVIAVLLTKSTTGIIILFLICFVLMIKHPKSLVIIILALLVLNGLLSQTITDQTAKLATGNFAQRFENTLYVFKNYWKNILGIGSTQYDKIYAYDKRIGSWDTFSNLYLRFGLFYLVLLLYSVFKLRTLDWSLLIVVFFSLLTESILGPIIFILMKYSRIIHGSLKEETDTIHLRMR